MNYSLKIIDTLNNSHVTELEKSERKRIVLDHKGADKTDELTIVGSTLSFTMVNQNKEDGYYYDLFTGDETRFKTILKQEDEVIIWEGFLLPDSYREPYSNTQVFDFVATDGLGRLKGKFLPEDYYKDEKSVIDILSTCLGLTGLTLPMRFAPAIENIKQKDYNLIYLDTALFVKSDKKQDAYKILDDLLSSMFCSVYQQEGYFNIEGQNIRNLRVYKTKVYDFEGNYIEEVEVTRNRKDVTGIERPQITMQAPYGIVDISHKRELLGYEETIYKEENDGWVTYNEVNGDPESISGIHPTDWFAYNGAELSTYDGGIAVPQKKAENQYMIPKTKLYVERYEKYNIKFEFAYPFEKNVIYTDEYLTTNINNGTFDNVYDFEIAVNYTNFFGVNNREVIFSNNTQYTDNRYQLQRPKDESYDQKLNLSFIPKNSGVLEIKIGADAYFTTGNVIAGYRGVRIDKVELVKLGQKEEEIFTNILSEDYTLKKEISLEYADDNTALSKSFRLKKLKVLGEENFINIPILRKFEFQGFYYSVVSLRGANLIKDNPDYLMQLFSSRIKVIDVIYNYNGSSDHVIKTEQFIAIDLFNLQVNDNLLVLEDREYWQQWSDSFYKIEKKRYAEAGLDLFKRGFDRPLPVIEDFTLKNNVKLNDFILFKYRNKSEWILNNCKWNIDTGYTTVSCSQRYYVTGEGELIPPTVDAGPDIYLDAGQGLLLSSKGFDPDGFIVSYYWEELTNNGAKFFTRNDKQTLVSNTAESYYEFKVTVTDNDGLTGFDTVKVYRKAGVAVSLVQFYEDTTLPDQFFEESLERRYKLTFTEDIPEGTQVLVKGSFSFKSFEVESYSKFSVIHNGVTVLQTPGNWGFNRDTENINYSINYIKGDVIHFMLRVDGDYDAPTTINGFASTKVQIDEVNFVDGIGDITGYPLSQEVKIIVAE